MEKIGKMQKRNRLIDIIVFFMILAGVSAVTLILFVRQVYGNTDIYSSDMQAYIMEMQGLESGYSFPYPVFFKLSALLHLFLSAEIAVAVATMLLNDLALIIVKIALNHLALQQLEKKIRTQVLGADITWAAGIIISILSASLFFISMLYPPTGIYLPGIRFKYVGVFSANPFHNATYMAARPFALLAFLWYVKLLPVYENGLKENEKLFDYLLFSVFLLIATMTKPSFTLVFVSAAGLLMLYRLIRAKFQNFVPSVQLGLCFVPTFLDLLYQYRGVFYASDNSEKGIGFCFGDVWALYCDNIPLAIFLAVAFPLLVLCLNYKKLKEDTMFRFSWILYLVGFAEAFLLYEKGFREVDFNFSWGYMYGIFFCHFGALAMLLQTTARQVAGINKKRSGFHIALQWLMYVCHIVCGVAYFLKILAGKTYY